MSTKSTSQLEAAACDVVTRFHRDIMGRGPRSVTATLQKNMLFIHLEGVLTKAETTLVSASGDHQPRNIEVVREMRHHLVHQARNDLLAALSGTIGMRADGMMHDIDPMTSSEVLVFHLAEEPQSARQPA